MGQVMQITCLLFIAMAVTSLAAEEHQKRKVQKSKLILEYNWPEPTKNLKRLPHPESCFHFYLTTPDGSHAIKKCHEGRIFDYRSLRCMEKSFAKCWKDIVKKGNTKKVKRYFSCPFPWGLYPDSQDCSQFYDCLGGKSYPRKCPASTLFDKAERTCVSENEAMCADQSDMVEPGYKCPYKWGFYTHPRDCSKYYECLRKVPSIRTCKKKMLFDNFKRRCLPMSTVDCGARLNPYDSINKLSTEQIRTENTQNILEHATSENTPVEHDEVVKESTPASPGKFTQENIPARSDKTAQENIQLRTDKSAQENTPSITDEVAQETVPTEHGEVAQKNTPSNHSETEQQNTQVKLDKVVQENTKPIPHKVVQEATTAGSDKVAQENTPAKPNKNVQKTIPPKHNKIAQENTPTKPDKVAQETIPTQHNANDQENMPPKPDKVAQETIPTQHNANDQENTPASLDKVTLRNTEIDQIKLHRKTLQRDRIKVFEKPPQQDPIKLHKKRSQ